MDTKSTILKAAKEEFTQKGFAGARMQQIADKAGINKGLLHYYFKSKKALFNAVFNEIFDAVSPQIHDILTEKQTDIQTKIDLFVDRYMQTLLENPFFVSHVICELNANPNRFISNVLTRKTVPNPLPFIAQFQEEVNEGKIKSTDPFQLIMSIISMCIFPFVGRPIIQLILDIESEEFLKLMDYRKEWIKKFVKDSIRA